MPDIESQCHVWETNGREYTFSLFSRKNLPLWVDDVFQHVQPEILFRVRDRERERHSLWVMCIAYLGVGWLRVEQNRMDSSPGLRMFLKLLQNLLCQLLLQSTLSIKQARTRSKNLWRSRCAFIEISYKSIQSCDIKLLAEVQQPISLLFGQRHDLQFNKHTILSVFEV